VTRRITVGSRRLAFLAVGASLSLDVACSPPGPHEDALTQAIVQRDVATAQRAIAAGVNYRARVRQNVTLSQFIIDEMLTSPRESEALERIGAAMFAAGADANASISITRRRSVSLAEKAVETGSPILIEAMIRAGLRMKSDGTGRALVTACRLGYTAVVERLVTAGADVNYHWWGSGTIGCLTPLSEAVQGRHEAIIELLERAGATEW
jgi:hypothetical protein